MKNQSSGSMGRDLTHGEGRQAQTHAPSHATNPPSERHLWAIAALFFPLIFCAIVGLGVFLMFHRQMAFFKPAPSGSSAPGPHGATLAAKAHWGA